jgi:hypothetical protein
MFRLTTSSRVIAASAESSSALRPVVRSPYKTEVHLHIITEHLFQFFTEMRERVDKQPAIMDAISAKLNVG